MKAENLLPWLLVMAVSIGMLGRVTKTGFAQGGFALGEVFEMPMDELEAKIVKTAVDMGYVLHHRVENNGFVFLHHRPDRAVLEEAQKHDKDKLKGLTSGDVLLSVFVGKTKDGKSGVQVKAFVMGYANFGFTMVHHKFGDPTMPVMARFLGRLGETSPETGQRNPSVHVLHVPLLAKEVADRFTAFLETSSHHAPYAAPSRRVVILSKPAKELKDLASYYDSKDINKRFFYISPSMVCMVYWEPSGENGTDVYWLPGIILERQTSQQQKEKASEGFPSVVKPSTQLFSYYEGVLKDILR